MDAGKSQEEPIIENLNVGKCEEIHKNKVVQMNDLTSCLDKVNLTGEDPRQKLKSWLGKTLRIVITDGRVIIGTFVCTDRDGNVILEHTWEWNLDKCPVKDCEPRPLGLAMVPGKHLKSISVQVT